MATAREIKNRISSVKNIKKITETMEKIATAKIRQSTSRLTNSRDYYISLIKLVNHLIPILKEEGESYVHPLIQTHDTVDTRLIFVITSNRGLCGGYNNNVLQAAKKLHRRTIEENKKPLIYVSGKKGVTFFKYNNIEIEKGILEINDKTTYENILALSKEFNHSFCQKKANEIYFVYTKFYGPAKQKAVVEKVLPFDFEAEDEGIIGQAADYRPIYSFEPDIKGVLNHVLPIALSIKLFNVILETNLSEHIARKVAMKQATDSAGDMIKELSLEFNRARQAKITKELIEIMGAAKAISS